MYTSKQRRLLLDLARRAISGRLSPAPLSPTRRSSRSADVSVRPDPDALEPALLEKRGTFVTLTVGGRLRGCIGHLEASQPLHLDVAENALHAAFEDPRFPPLRPDELPGLEIEISVLGTTRPLSYRDPEDLLKQLAATRPGVIIAQGGRSATYLPQVWEEIPDPPAFLSSLCLKAGLPADAWQSGSLQVQTYTVEKF